MERESLLLAMSTVYPLQVLVNLSDDLDRVKLFWGNQETDRES